MYTFYIYDEFPKPRRRSEKKKRAGNYIRRAQKEIKQQIASKYGITLRPV
jgi:hypothetical protein